MIDSKLWAALDRHAPEKQSCGSSALPVGLGSDKMCDYNDCSLASCDSHPLLSPLKLSKECALDDGALVSCDSKSQMPPLKLTVEVDWEDGSLISCDPKADLPASENQSPVTIAPWEKLEWSQQLYRKPDQQQTARFPTPDISRGLGQRQAKKDIVALDGVVNKQGAK